MCSSLDLQSFRPRAKQHRVCFEMEGDSIKAEFCAPCLFRETVDEGDLWWQPSEFDKIKQSAVNSTLLMKGDDDFFPTKRNTSSYIRTLMRVHKVASSGRVMSTRLLDDLTFWTSNGHSRRGLEKITVEEMGEDRVKQRKTLITAVLFMQQKCRETRMTYDQCSRLLRVTSEKLSKTATCMAIIMGTADMLAVNIVPQEIMSLRFENVATKKTPSSSNREMMFDSTREQRMMITNDLPLRSTLRTTTPRTITCRSA